MAASVMAYKNTWGSAAPLGQGIDQARSDLFLVNITPPAILPSLSWDEEIAFAITKFPFPAREREMIAIKYMQQTNYQIGADTAMGGIEIPVRYAFNQLTAQRLEEWHWATSNPNGAVALTSAIKTNGMFYWLAPNTAAALSFDMTNPLVAATDAFNPVCQYVLEGILLKGLKPSPADMEARDGLVTYDLTLQIDRYYPLRTSDLVATITG
jgi:hypothetical protein